MKLVLFCHSLASDWNHGNAHFLRGVARELQRRGHQVEAFEPADSWSLAHLRAREGDAACRAWRTAYPDLASRSFDPERLDLDAALDGASLVLVHEWSDPGLVARLGRRRKRGGGFRLLFHDTHHRAVTAPHEMARFDLSGFDGVLAFGEVLSEIYRARGWGRRVWTWHEAADVSVFRPLDAAKEGDVVWVGNWGDDERTRELDEFLLGPVRRLRLAASVHGVRYPEPARRALAAAGIAFRGYLPNHRVPRVLAGHRATVHVPRRPYAEMLRGIPTIRVFEALACGIPLVSAPWDDAEGLFRPGEDFLLVRDGEAMERALAALLAEPARAATLAASGLETIRARHTCGHRVDELLAIASELGLDNNGEAQPCAAA
jgi:spore maturation protein CgeB